jgi:hypothetical protein
MTNKPVAASLAAASLMLSTSPAVGQTVTQTDAEQIAILCPVPALSGIQIGMEKPLRDESLRKSLSKLPSSFAPFTEATLEITPWSQKLAGVTYLAESHNGPPNQAWSDALAQSLTSSGWTPSQRSDLASPLTFNAIMFEKAVNSTSGSHVAFIEFDTPGALMLRCGDAKLLEIQKKEHAGQLEPGSLRPANSQYAEIDPKAKDVDCDNPLLLEAFREPSSVDESNAAFLQFVARSDALSGQRSYGERLVTWLKWKLIGSGEIDEDKIRELEDKAAQRDGEAKMSNMMDAIGAMGDTAKAQEQRDGRAMCHSLARIMEATAKVDRSEIAYHAKVAQALEQEGRRLGINVD